MKKQIIITIHGIRTKALRSWQPLMWEYIKGMDPDIKVFTYKYGYLLAPISWYIAVSKFFKIPLFYRKHTVGKFAQYMENIQNKFPDHDISIIAHSFGTWISYNAIGRNDKIKIRNLVLIAGVISSHVEKLELLNWIEEGRIKTVHSWSSHSDKVVCKCALPPFGKLGHRGFVRYGKEEDKIAPQLKPYQAEIYNHHTDEEHGGVISKLAQYGKQLFLQLTA